MLGTSTNLISFTGCMNPTDPPSVGSLGIHLAQVPQFSVMPYPSKVSSTFPSDQRKGNRPCKTVQARVTRRKSRTCGFNGADPEVTSARFPPRAARTYIRYVHQSAPALTKVPCHLVKHKSIPKWMRVVSSGLDPLHLDGDGSPE